jgi:hypothetical protein
MTYLLQELIAQQMAGDPLYATGRLEADLTSRLPEDKRPRFRSTIRMYRHEAKAKIHAAYDAEKSVNIDPKMDLLLKQRDGNSFDSLGKLAAESVAQLPDEQRVDFIKEIQIYCEEVRDKIQAAYDAEKS